MERKNTVLLTVIAVATLLVAVVGATFAYFTATNTGEDNSQGSSAATTAKLANIKLNAASITGTNLTVYPGTMNWVGASVTAELDTSNGADDSTNYSVGYKLTGSIVLDKAFEHDVTYTLYKVEGTSAVDSPVTCVDVTPTYEGTTAKYSQSCSLSSSLTSKEVVVSPVEGANTDTTETGKIKAGETKVEFTYDYTIATNSEDTHYYYLVVSYPNEDSTDQNNDQGKNITASIKSIAGTSTTVSE